VYRMVDPAARATAANQLAGRLVDATKAVENFHLEAWGLRKVDLEKANNCIWVSTTWFTCLTHHCVQLTTIYRIRLSLIGEQLAEIQQEATRGKEVELVERTPEDWIRRCFDFFQVTDADADTESEAGDCEEPVKRVRVVRISEEDPEVIYISKEDEEVRVGMNIHAMLLTIVSRLAQQPRRRRRMRPQRQSLRRVGCRRLEKEESGLK
ncbi:MAG: hypothetical protein MI748_12190, partial [Opitutales bacterium]|nr:hypothetical protein [Opitutales bacterium]